MVKTLHSYDFYSIFREFLKFEKHAPLGFTAELQGEWAELVCNVNLGSHFAWRQAERVTWGPSGMVQTLSEEKKYYNAW